jgi:hypothetical protein
MDEHSANIDIVFRNGLRNMEALPPPEVWDNIKPVIRSKQRSYLLLSTAALMALLISISVLAYRWSREVSIGIQSTGTAFSIKAASPVYAPSTDYNTLTAVNQPFKLKDATLLANNDSPLLTGTPEYETYEVPAAYYSRYDVSLKRDGDRFSENTLMRKLIPVQDNSFELKTSEQEYISEAMDTKSPERWSIAAMASPTYYSKFNTGTDEISRQMSSSEQPQVSYAGGLALAYRINRRLSVQTGLYYASIGQKVDGIISFGGFQPFGNSKGGHNFEVPTTSGTIYTDNSDVFLLASSGGNRVVTAYNNDIFDPKKADLQYLNNTLHQDFSYLELPVVLRYKIVDKTLAFNLIGGVSYNFLMNNDVYTTYNGGKYEIGTTKGLNSFTLSSSLGLGMEYSFNKNFSFNLEPTFRYYINPFSGVTGSDYHPYSFGIFSGVSYKF